MPKPVDECVESVLADNPDYSESRAYAICHAQQNKGNLSVPDNASHDTLLHALARDDGECPEGQVYTGKACVPIEDVTDAPPSVLNSEPRVMAQGDLSLAPIERDELGSGEVAYRNIKLLEQGVWTDQNSQTPTLYDSTTFKNLEAEYNSAEYDGPPVNIAHDVDAQGKPNDASLGGYVDPESLRANNDALFGDIVVDTSTTAGAFADENLQSALESQGEVGFSPSVEIDPNGEMELATEHPRAEHHATGGYLTGLGLVTNPASKPVDMATQTRQRAVAMSSQESMNVYLKDRDMDTDAKILEAIATRELQLDEIEDDAQSIADEVGVSIEEVMEYLSPLLDMDGEDEADGEPPENESDGEDMDGEEEDDDTEMGGYEDDEEDEEDDENPMMAEEAYEAMEEEIDELWEEVDQLREQMVDEQMMSDVADSDTVAELQEAKDEIEKRLSELESEPEDSRTLAEGNKIGDEWANADGLVVEDSNSL
jgi:hypothetical protein